MFFKFESPKIELLNKSLKINLNNMDALFVIKSNNMTQKTFEIISKKSNINL